MGRRSADSMPTTRQGTVLKTLEFHDRITAKQIGVRSDVLWRMEEIGWVARNLHEQWTIRNAGLAALKRWENRGKPAAERRHIKMRLSGELGDIAWLMGMLEDAAELNLFTMTQPRPPYRNQRDPGSRVYLDISMPADDDPTPGRTADDLDS